VSVTIEYYFNSPLELPALAEQLNVALGCHLMPFQDDTREYLTRLMGMPFELKPCDFENDGELEFESYTHSVRFRTRGRQGLQEIQLPALLCVAAVLQKRLEYDGMLVYDVDVLLARYKNFVDILSGTALDDFPAHLAAVQARVP
jgi:hypothetical protein